MDLPEKTTPKYSLGKILAGSCLVMLGGALLIPISIGLWYLNLQTKVLWKFDVGNTVMTAPLVTEDLTYFGSLQENPENSPAFYALDTQTGKEVWKKPLGGSVFYPAVLNEEMVFFGTDAGFFYGLDRKTGQERWSFGPEQRHLTVQKSCVQCELKFGPPIIANGIIYVGSFDHSLYALEALTGQLKWKFETNDSILNAPLLSNGKLYVGGRDVYLYVLDPQTGKEMQRYLVPVDPELEKFKESGVHSTPIVEAEKIYLVNGKLLALDLETGTEKWQFGNATMSDLIMTATPFDNRIIITTTEAIQSINQETGQIEWSFSNIQGEVFFAPTITQDSVYFGDSDGYLYRIDAKTGHLDEKYHLNLFDLTSYTNYFNEFVFTPTVQAQVIYVGWNNHVYAIKTK